MVQSRNKGNAAERLIAGYLEEWWRKAEPWVELEDGKKHRISFVRTPLSGGWGGPAVRAGFRASGDVMTTAKKFPFVVEVKRRESWSLNNVLDVKPCPVWAWWRQTLDAAAEMGGEPLMFVKKNSARNFEQPWLVFARRDYIFEMGLASTLDVVFEEGSFEGVRPEITPSFEPSIWLFDSWKSIHATKFLT